jgi:2-amino-4-hydroxy-6-hydroxymethyldihydropteridine diphosphokinase
MRTAYIGLGGNLASYAGAPADTLTAAVLRLADLGHVSARSSLYRTDPVGFAHQPRFVNAVVVLEMELEPRTLLKKLLEIEKEFGRDRSGGIPNGPRTLDLDILLVDDLVISEPGLELPHPRLAERAFALIPLSEVAPQVRIPGHEQTVAEMAKSIQSRMEGEADAVVRMESDRWRSAPLQ